jgi:hypothetical protein
MKNKLKWWKIFIIIGSLFFIIVWWFLTFCWGTFTFNNYWDLWIIALPFFILWIFMCYSWLNSIINIYKNKK